MMRITDPARYQYREEFVLVEGTKTDLADKLTAFRAEYAGVHKSWVHIVFHEYPIGSGFTDLLSEPRELPTVHFYRRPTRSGDGCLRRVAAG
jgi:hypothetical protein